MKTLFKNGSYKLIVDKNENNYTLEFKVFKDGDFKRERNIGSFSLEAAFDYKFSISSSYIRIPDRFTVANSCKLRITEDQYYRLNSLLYYLKSYNYVSVNKINYRPCASDCKEVACSTLDSAYYDCDCLYIACEKPLKGLKLLEQKVPFKVYKTKNFIKLVKVGKVDQVQVGWALLYINLLIDPNKYNLTLKQKEFFFNYQFDKKLNFTYKENWVNYLKSKI